MNARKIFFRIIIFIIFLPIAGIVVVYLNYQFISFSVKDQIYTNAENLPFQPFTLVFGTGNYAPEHYTNYSLIFRAEAAHQIVLHNKTNTIIASGIDFSEGLNEATDLKLVMKLNGVDSTKIILDSTARRTFISIQNAVKIAGDKSVTMVSQKDHLERALFIGNCIGIDAIGFVAYTHPKPEHKVMFREHLARVKCIYDCLKFNLF